MAIAENEKGYKPDYDKLSKKVQVLLKPAEYKIFEKLRRELNYSTNASFIRKLILESILKRKQTELF